MEPLQSDGENAGDHLERRVEERTKELELLQEINGAILDGAELDETLKLIATGVRRTFGYYVSAVFLLSEDRKHFVLKSVSFEDKRISHLIEKALGFKILGYKIPLYKGSIFTNLYEKKEPIINYPDHVEYWKQWTDKEFLKPLIAKVCTKYIDTSGTGIDVPIVANDQVIGMIQAASSTKMKEEDEKRLIAFGEQVGLAVQRAKLAEALKKSGEKYRTLVTEINDGIFVLDSGGTITFANNAFAQILGGHDPEEFVGENFLEFVSMEARDRVKEALNKAIDTGKMPELSVDPIVRKDGSAAFVENKFTPIIEKGRFVGVHGIARDITERQRTEAELDLLQQVNNALNRGTPLNDVLQMVVNGIREIFDYAACEIYLLETEKRDLVYTILSIDSNILKGLEKLTGIKARGLKIPLYEGSCFADVIENRRTYITGDMVEVFESFSENKRFKSLAPKMAELSGFKSAIKVPLVAEDEVLGILGASSKRDIAPGEVKALEGFASPLALAIRKAQTEEELRESEEKFRSFVETSADLVFRLTKTGHIEYVSPKVEELYGYQPEELIGKHLRTTTPVKEVPRAMKALEAVLGGKPLKNFEINQKDKTGRIVPVEINMVPVKKGGKIVALQGIMRDITERKRAEEEMRRRLMRFRLEGGKLYLVKEPVPTMSLEAFKDLLRVGHRGLIVSRTPERDFKGDFKGDYEFLWLAEERGSGALLPVPQEIEDMIRGLPDRTAVLFERLDYLVSKNGIEATLDLVQHLRELAYLSNHVIVLSIDPSTLARRELRLLEKETAEVEALVKAPLAEGLLDVLRFVYRQNAMGIKPSYSDIALEVGVSGPTVRKRLRELAGSGYVRDSKRGRQKVVELTEKGRRLF
jgi:PAS domain S-box-containing protein